MPRHIPHRRPTSITPALNTGHKPRYSLAELLSDMQPGDMPTDRAWDAARAVGREYGAPVVEPASRKLPARQS